MSTISIIIKEIVGLFVDDGSLAIGILVLVGAIALLIKIGLLAPLVGGGVLVLGLMVILVENLLRSAGKLGRR